MNKAYNKITWQNKPSTATPLNQTNLNEMSNALDTIDDRVIALDSGKVGSVTVTNTLPTGDTIATITVDGTATNIKSAQVVVDSTPSATSENPLQNKAIYEMLNNLLPEETVQGNPIAISDASGLNAKACSVDLLPIQDLHGYDSPWAGGAGKNKLQVTMASSTSQDITATVYDDGTVLLNGKSTGLLILTLNNTLTLNGNYILSGCPSGGSAGTFRMDCYWAGQGALIDDGNGVAISPNGNAITVRIVVMQGVTLNNQLFKPMIRLATETDPTFAPYSNICPISGRNSVEIKRTGKNLCNPADMYVFNSNKYFATTNYTTRPSIQVAPNTQYILSCRKGVVPGDYKIYYWDSNNTAISNEKADPFTTPSNCVGISFYCGYGDGDFTDADNVKAQVEVGSTATAYEPYQGETVTEQFGQTVYGGTLDVTNGKLTIDRAIVTYTGASGENWTKQSGGVYAYYISKDDFVKSLEYTTDLIRCDKLQTVERHNTMTNTPCSISGYRDALSSYPNNNWIYVYIDDTITSVELFKTWISNNNIQISYKLATPIEIILTAEQISLLKGNNILSTDGDNINLVYSADIGLYIAGQLQS